MSGEEEYEYGDDDAAKPLNPKRSVILNRASQCTDDWVKFDERPDESRAFVNATITMRDYLDMGEPGVITVTIEPGDLLSTQCADMTGTHFDGCDCGGES
jgi:phage terminase large subunit-like protein